MWIRIRDLFDPGFRIGTDTGWENLDLGSGKKIPDPGKKSLLSLIFIPNKPGCGSQLAKGEKY